MNLKTLYHTLRILPLMVGGITTCPVGIAVAVFVVGAGAVNWPLVILAWIGVVLLHWSAHPLNDILDLEADRDAPDKEAIRTKSLVLGHATVKEFSMLSLCLIAVAIALAGFITLARPLTPLFALAGLFFVLSYNTRFLRLSYHPYTEFIVEGPFMFFIVVGMFYVATGTIQLPAIVIGIIEALLILPPIFSLKSIDRLTDEKHGKITTIVKSPRVPWSSLSAAVALLAVIVVYGGYPEMFLPLVFTATMVVICLWQTVEVDVIRYTWMRGIYPNSKTFPPEAATARAAVNQVILLIITNVGMAGLFIASSIFMSTPA